MGIKKFIKNVINTLELKDYEVEGKKKSLKNLLKKLRERKKNIKQALKSSLEKKKEKELLEELKIISLQLKKGKKILHALYLKDNS